MENKRSFEMSIEGTQPVVFQKNDSECQDLWKLMAKLADFGVFEIKHEDLKWYRFLLIVFQKMEAAEKFYDGGS